MAIKKVLLIIGTRPELIKMAPLYNKMMFDPCFDIQLCNTGQHPDFLGPIFKLFRIHAHYTLDPLTIYERIEQKQAQLIRSLEPIMADCKPDLVLVQGDTLSCLAGAIAAFNQGIRIAHVEAGLRSGNPMSPYPEEGNRILVDALSEFHFPPSTIAYNNLLSEGHMNACQPTGNTGIDALVEVKSKLSSGELICSNDWLPALINEIKNRRKKVFLITLHRRELSPEVLDDFLSKLEALLSGLESEIIFSLHKNPWLKEQIVKRWSNLKSVHLKEAMPYQDFIFAMINSDLIISDSGGIQEEATYLGKPLLVIREETERPEVLKHANLTGYDFSELEDQIKRMIENGREIDQELFGVGNASDLIIQYLKDT